MSDDKVLLGLRPPEKNLPGLWEFPGGKIELGESPEAALVRELDEELGIKVKIDHLLLAVTHEYGETGILLLFYLVRFFKGTPKSLHHKELKWVKWSDIDNFQLPEANQKVLEVLKKAVGDAL